MTPVERLRLVGGSVAAGGLVGAVAVPLLVVTGSSAVRAAEIAFALGTLALGFGLLGWSGSVMAGRGVEHMQEYLDTNSDWTEANSRRAMARIGGFGAGVMAGSAVVELLAFGA